MRLRSLTCMGLLALAGCGPDGPPSLEGFGDVGESGDGDGDPGDGDPGDGDGECLVDQSIEALPSFYFEDSFSPELGDDFPNHCDAAPGDYALSWTAPFSGPFVVNLFAGFEARLTLLRGGCDGSLEGCSGIFPQTTSFEAIEGQEYTFVVAGEGDGWFAVELYPADVMPGTCPYGELFGFQDTKFGSTIGGGVQFGSDCGGFDAPERSYFFTPPVSGLYRIDTAGSSFDTILHVFEGYCGGPVLACNDDGLDSLASSMEVQLWIGNEYTIVVDGFGGDQGEYQLNLEYLDGEPGVCDDVTVIPPMLPFVSSWPVDATSEDLWHGCSFTSFEQRFIFIAPETGSYRVTQTAGLGNFSAVAVLLDGCEGNTQFCAGPDQMNQVEAEFDAVAGQELVIISEWDAFEPGEVTLTLDLIIAVDGCGEALPGIVPLMHAGVTGGSGNDHEGSCASNPAPERELHWTAPATGSYRFTLEGSEYDTLMYIRDGGCEGPELACNDDTVTDFGLELWSTIELDLMEGQTVSIFVDGYNGSGEYTLAITQI